VGPKLGAVRSYQPAERILVPALRRIEQVVSSLIV
jgi:hypothetical protein